MQSCRRPQRQRREGRLFGGRGRAWPARGSLRRAGSTRWRASRAPKTGPKLPAARPPLRGTATTRVATVAAVGATARSSTLGNSTSRARFRGTLTHRRGRAGTIRRPTKIHGRARGPREGREEKKRQAGSRRKRREETGRATPLGRKRREERLGPRRRERREGEGVQRRAKGSKITSSKVLP